MGAIMKKDVYNLSSSKMKRLNIDLSKEHFENIENIAKSHNVSSYSMFLAGLYILLYRYTYQNSINIILKKDINPNENFFDFVKSLCESATSSISNQLFERLTLDNNASSFSVLFSYTTLQENSLVTMNDTKESDLHFEVATTLNTLSLEFNENLLSLPTAKSLLSHYLFILKQIPKALNYKISNFEMITPEESRLLDKFNHRSTLINNDTLFSLFDTSVEKPRVYILDENMKYVPIGNFR